MPTEVIISVSDDNETFTELTRIEHELVMDDALTFKNFGWQGETNARYVRYVARIGKKGGWLFTDEIVIK